MLVRKSLLQHTRWRNRSLSVPPRPPSQQTDHSSRVISRYPHRAFLSTHHRFHWHRALRSMVIVRRGCLPPQAILCEMANSYCLLVMIQFRMSSSRFLPLPIPFKATSNRLLLLPVVLVKNHSLPLPILCEVERSHPLPLAVVLVKNHSLTLPIPSKTTTNHHFPRRAA